MIAIRWIVVRIIPNAASLYRRIDNLSELILKMYLAIFYLCEKLSITIFKQALATLNRKKFSVRGAGFSIHRNNSAFERMNSAFKIYFSIHNDEISISRKISKTYCFKFLSMNICLGYLFSF